MGVGADLIIKDSNNNFDPAGASISVLAGGAAEGHVWITDTKSILYLDSQIMEFRYDVPTWFKNE